VSGARIELTTRALRDLRKLDGQTRRRIAAALQELGGGAENLDVKALVGHAPYHRLRVGDWRVLYRHTTEQEAAAAGAGWFVFGVINRRDLERATRSL
jgi:mRNA-degrading endonuclease RelE of RelBE toxin-antitoxin system